MDILNASNNISVEFEQETKNAHCDGCVFCYNHHKEIAFVLYFNPSIVK